VYSEALDALPLISEQLKSQLFGNRALCLIKLGEYSKAIQDCDVALNLDSHYVKALLRRALCSEKLEEFSQARKGLFSWNRSHDLQISNESSS